jgi:hypothetical protein
MLADGQVAHEAAPWPSLLEDDMKFETGDIVAHSQLTEQSQQSIIGQWMVVEVQDSHKPGFQKVVIRKRSVLGGLVSPHAGDTKEFTHREERPTHGWVRLGNIKDDQSDPLTNDDDSSDDLIPDTDLE